MGQGSDAARLPVARGVQAARARREGQAAAARDERSSTSARRRAAGRRCCASGSGPAATIVAIDLLPMEPVAGVTFVQADFREDEGLAALEERSAGAGSTLWFRICPPIYRAWRRRIRRASVHLGELALEFAASVAATRRRSRRQSVPGRGVRGVPACRWKRGSPRSTCASPRRRGTAAARSISSAKALKILSLAVGSVRVVAKGDMRLA